MPNILKKSEEDIKKALERDNFMTPSRSKKFWFNWWSCGKKILNTRFCMCTTYDLITLSISLL